MMVAVLFPMDAPGVSWNLGRGVCATLKRMGIQPLPIDLPTVATADANMLAEVKKRVPPIETLRSCDAVLTCAPEHVGPWIEAVYERYEWRNLNVPTAMWLNESCERDDYLIDLEAIGWIGREWFFPAVQDAEKHDQPMFAPGRSHWLPYGVDTDMFSTGFHERRDYPVAFIGGIPQKSMLFLQALFKHAVPSIRLASVQINDIDGYDMAGSTHRYAVNLRRVKVFFNIPQAGRLLTRQVFEAMACGCLVVTPMLPPEQGVSKNMVLFEPGNHLVYYRASNLPLVAQYLREWTSDERGIRRAAIQGAGHREIHGKHSLDVRLTEIMAKLELPVRVN
jgi:hypothetical protein